MQVDDHQHALPLRTHPTASNLITPFSRTSSAPLVDQQVDVADHLGQRQERLGHRDVAPQLLGKLVAGARPLGDQLVDLLGAPARVSEALVDGATWSVIGSPCPGSTISAGSSRVLRSDSR